MGKDEDLGVLWLAGGSDGRVQGLGFSGRGRGFTVDGLRVCV